MTQRQVALAFLAHPDDAEFLCGGTLVRLADAGWEIHIATCTAGDCGTMTENPWAISAIRTAEGANAAALIGGRYHCLGVRDGMVCYDPPTVQLAFDLFRRIAPSLVIAHAPSDYHMDHEMASLLARSASFMYGAPNASRFPRHPDSHVPYLYYCDPFGGHDPFGRPAQPSVIIDVAAQLQRKTDMLACHVSQRTWLAAHHGMDEFIESMKRHAAERGRLINSTAAEAFIQHRGHPYPQHDILAELFPHKR